MKYRVLFFFLILLLLPAIARADGLAVLACVLEHTTFDKLIKEHGETAKIPDDALGTSSITSGYLKDDRLGLRFEKDKIVYLFTCARTPKGLYLYAIAPPDTPETRLENATTLNEPAKNSEKDAFVVIFRQGNFLKN